MENEEIEAPYRIISLSEIGPLVLGKWSQIYVGSKCIGRLGDLSFKPSKYDYIPDTQLKIQMVEPFLLSIQNPIYAIQSVKFVRIYSTETISYTCINDADDTSRITGSARVVLMVYAGERYGFSAVYANKFYGLYCGNRFWILKRNGSTI